MEKTLLDLYTDYLLCSFGLTTATGLSSLTEGAVSHDQVTRLLSGEKRTSSDLWRQVKPLVRKVQSKDGAMIIDDSIEEKPSTDPSALICSHWDHSKGRYVKGINFLTVLYQVGNWSLPVAFDVVTKTETVIDKKSGKEKQQSKVTKNERYREMLRAVVKNQIPFTYVLNDVWYASAENMRFVKGELDKEFIMPLKANRKVALSKEDKAQGRYQSVETLEMEESAVREIGPPPI